MLGPNVYFRDLWNQCINSKVPVTGTISKQKADEVGARCATIVLKKCGGHPGSAELWSLLRENSEAKLALMDAKMSNTFKSVFSIYTRDLQMKQEPQLHLDCLRDDWLKHPLRKHLTLPPLKDGKCQPSSIPKQEEKGTCQEKTLPTIKKEPFASLSKRKDCRKIRMPTYLQSPRSMAKSKYGIARIQNTGGLNPWSFELSERDTDFHTLLWEPLIGRDFKRCEYIASGTSKECSLGDSIVISISDGVGECGGPSANQL
ncbi:uncharacterized protein [Hemitrygon akajei]|uniref:uncharacterized protein isoform X4 n=1 Tax=Hemitrygon akajei TaxID=2704970 RepID=UPI003BF963B8